jgi:SAM-dependent methyltransferase
VEDGNKLTPGQVFARWRTMPEFEALVRSCYYDPVYEAAPRFAESEEFREVRGWAAAKGVTSGRVLDLGGGNGVAALAWRRAGFDAILLEPDRDEIVGYGALRAVRGRPEFALDVCAGIGEHLPFAAGSLDIVYGRQVLHHVSSLDAVAREVRRALRPGGLFIATREHVINRPDDLPRFLEKHDLHRYTGGENAHPKDAYIGALKRAGFAQVQSWGPFDSPVNFFPQTTAGLEKQRRDAIERRFGSHVTAALLKSPLTSSLIRRYFVWRSAFPGNMYSFLAVR